SWSTGCGPTSTGGTTSRRCPTSSASPTTARRSWPPPSSSSASSATTSKRSASSARSSSPSATPRCSRCWWSSWSSCAARRPTTEEPSAAGGQLHQEPLVAAEEAEAEALTLEDPPARAQLPAAAGVGEVHGPLEGDRPVTGDEDADLAGRPGQGQQQELDGGADAGAVGHEQLVAGPAGHRQLHVEVG